MTRKFTVMSRILTAQGLINCSASQSNYETIIIRLLQLPQGRCKVVFILKQVPNEAFNVFHYAWSFRQLIFRLWQLQYVFYGKRGVLVFRNTITMVELSGHRYYISEIYINNMNEDWYWPVEISQLNSISRCLISPFKSLLYCNVFNLIYLIDHNLFGFDVEQD